MGRRAQVVNENRDVLFCSSGIRLQWSPPKQVCFHPGGLFASVGQGGMGFEISSDSRDNAVNQPPLKNLHMQYVSESDFRIDKDPELVTSEVGEVEEEGRVKKKKKDGFRFKVKIKNPSVRRLVSGAIAGAVSRTAVAPLETIRTLLMVGSCGHSTTEVFQSIMKTDGWKGLFRGNFVNVIRVAPSKAIELFAYDTIHNHLIAQVGGALPIPPSSVAGALAGVTSTIITYPLELLKTRLTVQRGVYKNLSDALVKIAKEEGIAELYRGLTPSLIGVVPYAAANYFAYESLKTAYKKAFNKEEIGNLTALLIGSAAGAFSSTATFPLEVARKHMQAGALNSRQYNNMLHALTSILEKEGVQGLYRGLGPSCVKLVPAAGISFMCYEALKRILVEDDEENQ